jgi:threonine dehydratase
MAGQRACRTTFGFGTYLPINQSSIPTNALSNSLLIPVRNYTQLAREIVSATPDECEYVPPFDHPTIWEGHASMISEIAEHGQLPQPPAAVVVSVGGGGLLCGVLEGLKKTKGWEAVPVIAVETVGADSLFQAMQQDK